MDRIQLRRDTSARWKELNPVLLEGEPAFETDTRLRKIGDGVNKYNDIDYLAAENVVQELGNSETAVISQIGVTTQFERVTALESTGYVAVASYDALIEELIVFSSEPLEISLISIQPTRIRIALSSTIDGSIKLYLDTSNIASDNIYKIPQQNSNSKINDYGYIKFKEGSSIDESGIHIALTQKAYNIKYSGDILTKLELSTEEFKQDSEGFLKGAYPYVPLVLKELYLNPEIKDSYFISLFRVNLTNGTCNIFIKDSQGNNVFKIYRAEGLLPNTVYPLAILDGSNSFGYIVFKEDYMGNIDFTPNAYLNNNVFDYSKSPLIESNTINSLLPKAEGSIQWCTYSTYNNLIEELYLPNIVERYGEGVKLTRMFVTKDTIQIHLRNSSNTAICVESRGINMDYYKYGGIMTLYDYATHMSTIGFIKVKYSGTDITIDNGSVLNIPVVTNIENSPTIKGILNSGKQIWLMGDSLFGQPINNCVADILMALTGEEVLNIGCGGCRMSWRTPTGSSYYDYFSGVSIAQSLVNGDYTPQIQAMVNNPSETQYPIQVANMKRTDVNKSITILCDYINNDITGSSPIGNLWNYTDTLDSYVKNTFLGGMNYVIQTLLTKNPKIKFSFITDSFRWRNNSSGISVPPYAYVNPIGIPSKDYTEKEIENCSRLGLHCSNFQEWGIRNAFSMNSITVDGTHFNAYGFTAFVKYLYNLYKEIN